MYSNILAIAVLCAVTLTQTFGASEGNEDYITYHPGTLPIIIGAPHGGALLPDGIPVRQHGCWNGSQCIWTHTCGERDAVRCRAVTLADRFTKEVSLLLREELHALYGAYPHLIVNELHRSILDANRRKDEAAFGNPSVEAAWEDFHGYINQSKAASSEPSLYLDIHGHAHPLERVELGYLLSANRLDTNNLDPGVSSINRLASAVSISFEDLLRGNSSYGGILEEEGYPSVPSPSSPGPDGNPYFTGGFDTRMHGSRYGGNTDAIQIESPPTFRAAELRPAYTKALAKTTQRFMEIQFGFTATVPSPDDGTPQRRGGGRKRGRKGRRGRQGRRTKKD